MEYFRDENLQIQADIAFRLGKIILQYEKLNVTDKFEVTLCISVLQTVLTSSVELLDSLSKHERKDNPIIQADINNNLFGIKKTQIAANSFQSPLTCDKVMRHIRNALSHPTSINLDAQVCSTGYSTIQDNSGIINKICFVSSPDYKRDKIKSFETKEELDRFINQSHNKPDFPEDYSILEENGKFFISQNEQKFVRLFKIVLTAKELKFLALALCNYLSHPIKKQWNGHSYKFDIIAA